MNILDCVKAQGMRFRAWVARRLWAKLIAGALLLPIMGVIEVSIGIQAGFPGWLIILALLMAYLAYCALVVFLHWTYVPPSPIRPGGAGVPGLPGFIVEWRNDLQQRASIRQLEQLVDTRRLELLQQWQEQGGSTIDILTMIQAAAVHSGSPDVEPTSDDEQDNQNGGKP